MTRDNSGREAFSSLETIPLFSAVGAEDLGEKDPQRDRRRIDAFSKFILQPFTFTAYSFRGQPCTEEQPGRVLRVLHRLTDRASYAAKHSRPPCSWLVS